MIPRGRRSDKKSETTDGEKRQLRAVWGSINWVQRESRPDVSALASLGMGSLNHSTVQDLCDANVAVERLKAEPFLGIKLPHISFHQVRWATVQDASWANAAEDHSQGAFLVGATSPGLWNNLPSPFALLSHKSHCLKRKCSSTLAAETQIMSEALAEVEWIRGLFEELTNPKFSIVEWATRSRNRGLLIAPRSSDAEARLPKVLSTGDAKSLYDHLRTETSGGANDRRTAIDIQIIRASMDAQGALVRWVDHSGMYADAMTKKNGPVSSMVRDIIKGSRSLWLRQDVRVIQNSKQMFTWGLSALACRQRVVHTQTEHQGHEGIPLLATFALSDVVLDPLIVLPHVSCGLTVCKSCKWQEVLDCRDFQQLGKHRAPIHVILSSHSFDRGHCQSRVGIGEGSDDVVRAICPRSCGVNICVHTLAVLVLCIFCTCRAFRHLEVFLSRCSFCQVFMCTRVRLPQGPLSLCLRSFL